MDEAVDPRIRVAAFPARFGKHRNVTLDSIAPTAAHADDQRA